jgi:hypothetical protein
MRGMLMYNNFLSMSLNPQEYIFVQIETKKMSVEIGSPTKLDTPTSSKVRHLMWTPLIWEALSLASFLGLGECGCMK